MNLRSIGIAVLILGILFKILHWPGANVILLTSAAVATVAMTILLIKKPGPWSIQIHQPIWLFGSMLVAFTGLIFKIMHWPGANIQLLVGMMGCAAWFLLSGVMPPKRVTSNSPAQP